MPNNATAKIESALKYWRIAILVVVAALVAVAIFSRLQQPVLQLGDQRYRLEVAASQAAQAKGLGDRDQLAANSGMLFPQLRETRSCYWMKDMRFSLDIIWVDAHKKITHIEKRLAPDTYPQAYCATAQYVIELNAGEAAKYHLTVGQTLHF